MAHFVIDAGLRRMRDPLARRFISAHLPYLVPAAAPAPALASAPTSAADPAGLMRLPIDRQPI